MRLPTKKSKRSVCVLQERSRTQWQEAASKKSSLRLFGGGCSGIQGKDKSPPARPLQVVLLAGQSGHESIRGLLISRRTRIVAGLVGVAVSMMIAMMAVSTGTMTVRPFIEPMRWGNDGFLDMR